jgi:hypothetical protein
MDETKELPATIDLKKYHGDTWSQMFRFLDGTVPHDLSDTDISVLARSNGVTTRLDVTIGDPGEITIQPPPEGLPIGQYSYDVQLTEAGSSLTWIKGTLNIHGDVKNG